MFFIHCYFILSQYLDSCKTEEGLSCVFPFIYEGVTYNSCTKEGEDYHWCATSVNEDLTYDGFGFCEESCYSFAGRYKKALNT